MNAIIIKVNEKVICVSKIVEIPQRDFIELTKEVQHNWLEKDIKVAKLENHIIDLQEYTKELESKINYLGKQIAIDRGEIDEDSEEEYVITIEKIKHEQPQPIESEIEHPTLEEDAEIVEPEVSEEEDAYFEEKEESEVTE